MEKGVIREKEWFMCLRTLLRAYDFPKWQHNKRSHHQLLSQHDCQVYTTLCQPVGELEGSAFVGSDES